MIERRPRLEGKVAIVTGAGSIGPGIGNGKATAILFAREGAKVLLADQFAERAQETLELINAEGGVASVFEADVSKAADCRAMVEVAVERYGRLDILHNNVGIQCKGSIMEVDEELWDNVMAINLKGMMLTSRFAIPQMIAGGGGAIINISSTAALRSSHNAAYAASKGGIVALTRAMAVDFARDHVRVNCIAPGAVFTPRIARRVTAEIRELRRREPLLEIEGSAWDVAWAAVYLASDEARWVTGIVLVVDGGEALTRREGEETAVARSRGLT